MTTEIFNLGRAPDGGRATRGAIGSPASGPAGRRDGRLWSSVSEAAIVATAAAHLARQDRGRAAATVVSAWVGAQLGVLVAGGGPPGVGVGAAYGLGRIAPPWRIPLLGLSGSLQVSQALRANQPAGVRIRRWVAGLAGAMAAVAVAERWPVRPSRQARRRQLAVVVNMHSGSAHLVRRALRALRRQPVAIMTLERTSGPRLADALERATASLPHDGILVVAGGDGTVGLGAAKAVQTGHVLAIFPMGTGNDVARSLGIPLAPEEAAALVSDGEPAPMDLGVTDSQVFAHAATVGMTAEFAEHVRSVRGWRRPLVYPVMAWRAWRTRRPLAIEVVVDGKLVATPAPPFQVGVVNAPRVGGRLGFALSGAAVDDGRLEVLVAHRGALRQAVKTLVGYLRSGSTRPLLHTIIEAGAIVEIRSPTPVTVCLDGEPVARTPLRARARAGACQVIRPRPRA